ncbi:MAG: stress response translation initiation inhibitor YciH [Dehalococcoidia bacterium]|nr:stress response translation initiation inhibitor YciH [Dehalococcoidia bacterium]
MASDPNSHLVYSSDGGRVDVPKPPKRASSKGGQASRSEPPDDGVVRIRREKQGRGGKTVTAITGLPGSEADLDALLKALKQHIGAGGTREGRSLVIQGDHRERVRERLEMLGHRPKLAGG